MSSDDEILYISDSYILINVIDFSMGEMTNCYDLSNYFLVKKNDINDEYIEYFEDWYETPIGKDEIEEDVPKGAKLLYNLFCKNKSNDFGVNIKDHIIKDKYSENIALLYKDFCIEYQFNIHFYNN
jgi:hypothetical protein